MATSTLKKPTSKGSQILMDGDPVNVDSSATVPAPPISSTKKKKTGSRFWLRFDSSGLVDVFELDRNAIMERTSIPARDLRLLGPIFSQSSHILARERAMVVNLDFIKAIITSEELLLLDGNSLDLLPFVDQLKETFSLRNDTQPLAEEEQLHIMDGASGKHFNQDVLHALVPRNPPGNTNDEKTSDQLPFEFRVLEIVLDFVCNFLEDRVLELESKAYPTLDELTRNVTSSNLELVRSLKSHLTRLTGRVQQVRDELEQLLDDDSDMAELYLTRKAAQWQYLGSASSDGFSVEQNRTSNSNCITSMAPSVSLGNEDVEELEMLLEAYFMQVDGTRNKLTMIREYIDDTEDYLNIQLDHQRNQLFQFHITLAAAALAVAIATALCSSASMNIPWFYIYDPVNNFFVPFLTATLILSVVIFFSILGYVHWTGLFES